MRVGSARYITLIDLRRGPWQVPLEADSQLATAFVSHLGQFAWKVMPFGLKNAAATFQRNMNDMLSGHENYACAYLDDIAAFSMGVALLPRVQKPRRKSPVTLAPCLKCPANDSPAP